MSGKYLNLTGLGTLWAKIKTALAGKQDDLSAVLPTDASATNQLATKAYADAIGERLEARYLGSSADGSPFATHAALSSATAYYYQGTATTPDTNDITTVTADEDHIGTTGEASTTRYRWNGTVWAFEYVINNTGLSETQLMAVNSGVTAAKVSGYDGLSGKISSEASARQTADNAKLNIDGTNATSAGVVEILKQVPTGTTTFTDYDNILGSASSSASGDANSKKTVRRPVTDLWNYVKGKIATWLGADADSSGALVNKSALLNYGAVQRVHGTANVNCWAATAKRTDTGNEVAFGIGSGGENRGIWDETRSAWAFKIDSSDKDSIPGWASIGNSGEPVYFGSDGRPAKMALLNTRQNAGYAFTNQDSTRKSQYACLWSLSMPANGGATLTRAVSGTLLYVTTGNAIRGSFEIYQRRSSGAVGSVSLRIRWQGGNAPSVPKFYAAVYDAGASSGERVVFRMYVYCTSNWCTAAASVDQAVDLANGVLSATPTYYTNSYSASMTGTKTVEATYLTTTSSGTVDSANKLTTGTTGSATVPVYFADGVPVACSGTLSIESWAKTVLFTIDSDGVAYGTASVSQPVSTTQGEVTIWMRKSTSTSAQEVLVDIVRNLQVFRTGNVGVLAGNFCPRPLALASDDSDWYAYNSSTAFKVSNENAVTITVPSDNDLGSMQGAGTCSSTADRNLFVSWTGNKLRFASSGDFSNFTRGVWYSFYVPVIFG